MAAKSEERKGSTIWARLVQAWDENMFIQSTILTLEHEWFYLPLVHVPLRFEVLLVTFLMFLGWPLGLTYWFATPTDPRGLKGWLIVTAVVIVADIIRYTVPWRNWAYDFLYWLGLKPTVLSRRDEHRVRAISQPWEQITVSIFLGLESSLLLWYGVFQPVVGYTRIEVLLIIALGVGLICWVLFQFWIFRRVRILTILAILLGATIGLVAILYASSLYDLVITIRI